MTPAGGRRRRWRLVYVMIQIAVVVGTNMSADHEVAVPVVEVSWPRDVLIRRLVEDFAVHLNIDYINLIIEGA